MRNYGRGGQRDQHSFTLQTSQSTQSIAMQSSNKANRLGQANFDGPRGSYNHLQSGNMGIGKVGQYAGKFEFRTPSGTFNQQQISSAGRSTALYSGGPSPSPSTAQLKMGSFSKNFTSETGLNSAIGMRSHG